MSQDSKPKHPIRSRKSSVCPDQEPMDIVESEYRLLASPVEQHRQSLEQPVPTCCVTRCQQKTGTMIGVCATVNATSSTPAIASQHQQHHHNQQLDQLCQRLQRRRQNQHRSNHHNHHAHQHQLQHHNHHHHHHALQHGHGGNISRKRSSAISAKSKNSYLTQYKDDKTDYFNGVLVKGRLAPSRSGNRGRDL